MDINFTTTFWVLAGTPLTPYPQVDEGGIYEKPFHAGENQG